MQLSDVQRRFILHWGEMGSRWGINRTVAQIHALLYISEAPLHAEAICEALGLARSGVSTGLKELQGWGIVQITHLLGDRRDHFTTQRDVWELFAIIIEERKRREFDPTLALLKQCRDEAHKAGPAEQTTAERMSALLDFFEAMDRWYGDVARWPRPTLLRFLKLGGKIRKLLRL